MIDDNFWESEEIMSKEESEQILQKIEEEEEEKQELQTPLEEEEEERQYQGSYDSEENYKKDEEEEELETDLQVLKDASLRLEQGNLYKMLLKHDLFEGVEADPRAIKNVQRELRAFIRERLEVLVGLKQDPKLAPKKTEVQLPFSDIEIQLLKEFLAKVTGKVEQQSKATSLKPIKTESQTTSKIKPVVGNSKNVKVVTPQKAQPKPQVKAQPKQDPPKDEPKLQKSPYEMTPEELIEYNKIVSKRQQGKKVMSPNRLPMPDAQQIQAMYVNRIQTQGGGGLINAIMAKMGKGSLGLIENVNVEYDDSNDSRI
jgi:hypothetical protein